MSVATKRALRVAVASLLVLSAASVPVFAQTGESERPVTEMTTYDAIAAISDAYNERAAGGGFDTLKTFFAGERVNIVVREGNDTEEFSFDVDDDMQIADLRAEHHPEATARIELERSTVEDVMTAENPEETLAEAFADGEVTIRGERGDIVRQSTWALVRYARTPLRHYYTMTEKLGWSLSPLW